MSTIHAISTTRRRTVDEPSTRDWRGGRAVTNNIIPASAGRRLVGNFILSLNGKLTYVYPFYSNGEILIVLAVISHSASPSSICPSPTLSCASKILQRTMKLWL